MSEKPTNLDIQLEQERQRVLLETLHQDISEIKSILSGKEGLVLDVDRLKRSRSMNNAIIWVIFTAAVGTITTAIAAYIRG